MSREKSLLKNTIIYGIGNFGSKLLIFMLLPLYTRYLTTDEYGYFDLLTNSVALITPIITLQVSDGLYRFLLDSNTNDEISSVINNGTHIVFKNLVMFDIIYLIFIYFVNIRYPYLILIQINVSVFSLLYMQIARGLRKNIIYSFSGVILTALTLICNIIFILGFKMGLKALIISNIIAATLVIAYLRYKLKEYFNKKLLNLDKLFQRKIIMYSVPLIPNVVSWWFMNVSDRFILNYYCGMQATGIYAVANKFPSIIMVINSIFILAWQESAINEYESSDKDEFYSRMFNVYMNVQITFTILIMSFTKIMINILTDHKFHSAYEYIPFLYIGAVFSAFSSFYGTGYLSSKETKGAFSTSIVGALVNIVFNIIFVPIIGIQAAAISTMLSFLIMWLIRLKQTQKYFKIKIDTSRMAGLLVLLSAYTILYYYKNVYIEIILIVFAFLILGIYNKPLIFKLINKT